MTEHFPVVDEVRSPLQQPSSLSSLLHLPQPLLLRVIYIFLLPARLKRVKTPLQISNGLCQPLYFTPSPTFSLPDPPFEANRAGGFSASCEEN